MTKDDDFDYWTQQTIAPIEPPKSFLNIETIEGVEPLDDQFAVEHRKTVPEALYDLLFSQSVPTAGEITGYGSLEAVPPMKTFAILDAARVTNLAETLETSGLEHRCLFAGDAYDDLKEAAPWIVQLEDGNTFTRNLFTRSDALWHMWDQEPGIYIRSRGLLNDLWKHFRKFTRIRDERGKWFYFRFWETGCLIDYIRYAQERDNCDLRFLFGFNTINRSHTLVDAYISTGPDKTQTCSVSQMVGPDARARVEIDMPILRFLAVRAHAHGFAESYFEAHGLQANAIVCRKAKDIATHIAQKYHMLGFKSRYHLGSFTYWVLALNADFETQSQSIQNELRRTNENSNDRFVRIARETKSLHGSKIRNYRDFRR